MFLTCKHHIYCISASECKPCSQPCGPASAQLSVQPQAPSGTGSSSSLSPASIAEDVFFGSTNEDQVMLSNLVSLVDPGYCEINILAFFFLIKQSIQIY